MKPVNTHRSLETDGKEANMYTTIPSQGKQPARTLSTDFDVGRYDVSVSPEEFFDSNISLSTVCPETALMYAVVEDAFQCFQRRFENESPVVQRAAGQAEEWFFSNDDRGLFSFVAICTALGLEPDFIRKRLESLAAAQRVTVTRSEVERMPADEIQPLIHELQVHEVELEETRDRYRELYDFAPVGYLTLNRTGTVLEANLAVANMLGVDRGELIQARLSRFVARDCQDAWYLYLQRFPGDGIKSSCELQLVTSKGVPVPVQVEAVSAMGEEPGNLQIRTCVTDMTKRKQLEEELRKLNAILEQRVAECTASYKQTLEALQRNEGWLRGFVDTTQEAVVSIDRRGRVVLFNPAAERIFGFDRSEVQGRKFNMLVPEPYASKHDGYIKRYEETGEACATGRIRTVEARRKNGEVFPIELSVVEIGQDDEVHYAAFIRDTSEKKSLETRLMEKERLAAVGATAAVVAHEISNPLNSISMTIQLIERKLTGPRDSESRDVAPKVKAIRGEIQRLTELLGDFTSLARKRKESFEPCSLEAFCGEILEIEAQRFTDSRVRVEQFFPGDLLRPALDKDAFKQALINLFKNAAEAMPAEGVLSVRAWNEPEHVVLEIGDTGPGVPAGVDIFAPFTTTKTGGTGLGMMIIRKIIADHGGTITCGSQPGKGAAFRLKLPVAASS